jgi:hypothetical protein
MGSGVREDEKGEEEEGREHGKNHCEALEGRREGVEDGGREGTEANLSTPAPFSQFSLPSLNLNTLLVLYSIACGFAWLPPRHLSLGTSLGNH